MTPLMTPLPLYACASMMAEGKLWWRLGAGERVLILVLVSTGLLTVLPFETALLAIVILIVSFLAHLHHHNSHWNRLSVPGPRPNLLLGNASLYTKGLATIDDTLATEFGDTYGTYLFSTPELCSSNLEVLRTVLVKEFDAFRDRLNLFNVDPDDRDSLLANSLVSLKGTRWFEVRTHVAPAFSSGRIKMMIPTLFACARLCSKMLTEKAQSGGCVIIDIKDIVTRLTLDMTSKAAFGSDFRIQVEETNDFLEMARRFTSTDFRSSAVLFITLFPNLARIWQRRTGITILNDDPNRFFLDVIHRIADNRKTSDEYRDFFSHLLDANISHEDVLGQAFMFLLAGFETTPSVLHLIFYMLAMHPIEQDAARREILDVCGFDDEVTAEQLAKLSRLDCIINEGLRLFPPLVRINRVCTRAVTLQFDRFSIPLRPGDVFTVPVRRIHHDPRHYPEPDAFRPDRFLVENRSQRDPLTFLPFGHGRRNCIGMRVALLQMRIALVELLRRHRFTLPADAPVYPFAIEPIATFTTSAKLLLIVEKLEKPSTH